ncbi:minor tail protein [Mycobacterium phage Watermelon]|uniref:D-Ala-D-Ala carboxypeptidase n=1 Tax=Mycobacterium phage Euphoria TaxID=2922223 RepID=G1EV84_9CAUD|nr:minor tail protein with lysin activity [Mycobacterium phage Euphoria]AEJ93693.1 D-Ala-D-Ala carboxypeptidase [Mycobacterium phage Euphoria]QGJ89350.1 minor tail protein [Mycobacterium phage Watermelon]
MPSGLRGYNVYRNGVRQNTSPVTELGSVTITGLTPGTDYSEQITITAIDMAGNESEPKTLAELEAEAATDELSPADPLDPVVRAQIDALVAAKIKPTSGRVADGAIIGVETPTGSYYKAYGGDRTSNTPLTLEKNFRYGSCSKMFTHTLILKAIDDGLLDWDDTISEFVTGVPNGDQITIRQLLLFQDGLKDWMTDPAVQQTYFLSPTTTYDPLNYIRNSVVNFAPGQGSSYSNAASWLLGKVLESVYNDGRTVDQIVVQEWQDAVDVPSLHWPTTNYMNPPYVRGWTPNLALPQIQAILGPFAFLAAFLGYPTSQDLEFTAVSTTWSGAAGSLAGTMADFLKLGKALYEGVFLSEEMRQLQQEIFSTYVFYEPDGPHQGPGWMGFGLNALRWGSWRGWVGNLGGYIAVLFYKETDGSVIGVMLNNFAAHVDAVDLFYQIAYLLDLESTEHVPWHFRPVRVFSGSVRAPSLAQPDGGGGEPDENVVPASVPFEI